MLAGAAYCTILDLQDCEQKSVELLAPVQTNSFSKSKMNTNGVGVSFGNGVLSLVTQEDTWQEPALCCC